MSNGFLQRPIAVVGREIAEGTFVKVDGINPDEAKLSAMEAILNHYKGRRVITYDTFRLFYQQALIDRPIVGYWMLPSDLGAAQTLYSIEKEPFLSDIDRAKLIVGKVRPLEIVAVVTGSVPESLEASLGDPLIPVAASGLRTFLKGRVEPGFRR